MSVSVRVKGHGLRWEGRALSIDARLHNGVGHGRCECGGRSPELPNTAARKRWHREHKQAVLDQLGPAATCMACDPPQGFPTFEAAQRHARAEQHCRIEVNLAPRRVR
jgi:hypothetical protein